MKAGIVAYTMAMAALKRLGVEPARRRHAASVIEEECTGNGALACLLAGHGRRGDHPRAVRQLR
ncbi:MAG: hypothetical protein U1F25_07770 [Rubrivivax sp.]